MMYELWIKGVNTMPTTDDASEVPTTGTTDALPTSLAEPSTDNGWVVLVCYGLSPELIDEGDTYETLGGAVVNDPKIFERFTIASTEYAFPADYAAYRAALDQLRKRFVCFAVKVYEDDVTLHAENKAVVCRREFGAEHTYEQGVKTITATLVRIKRYG